GEGYPDPAAMITYPDNGCGQRQEQTGSSQGDLLVDLYFVPLRRSQGSLISIGAGVPGRLVQLTQSHGAISLRGWAAGDDFRETLVRPRQKLSIGDQQE